MKIIPKITASMLLIFLVTVIAIPSALAYVPESYETEALTHPLETSRVCPVNGETTFKDTWNARRPGGRRHKGADMRAERRTPLVAAEDGTITKLRYDRAGGRTVYLESKSGAVYFYAHLDRYAEGQQIGDFVSAGDTVGYVGRSGNADVYHLHFGYRPDGSTPENPYPLLQKLCGEEKEVDEPYRVRAFPCGLKPW